VNAGVVGLLPVALGYPVWTSAILGPADVALALGAVALLVIWKLPPWLVVAVTALSGALVGLAIGRRTYPDRCGRMTGLKPEAAPREAARIANGTPSD
jgi:hypothetical protein